MNEAISPVEEDQQAIDFSSSVVGALQDKIEENNSIKLNITQLKKVYTHGARTEDQDKGLYAMARVNMYIRMKNEKNIISGKKTSAKKEKLTKLLLENASIARVDRYIDATKDWVPTDQDFAQAKEDIEKYGLTYKFKTVDDLYLSEYTKIDIEY